MKNLRKDNLTKPEDRILELTRTYKETIKSKQERYTANIGELPTNPKPYNKVAIERVRQYRHKMRELSDSNLEKINAYKDSIEQSKRNI